jgi:hypothetical protein
MYFSRRNEDEPFPPFPALTKIRAVSTSTVELQRVTVGQWPGK